MNTLAWVASVPATLWLAVYALNTLVQQEIFVALLGVMLVELVFIGLGIKDDLYVIMGGGDRDDND